MLLNNHDQTLWKLNINEYTIRRNKLTGKYVST